MRVSGVPYRVAAGDLMCYRVTERAHRVDVCHGGPRIMFMFGWCVPAGG
ncbi:hypothetical protein [Frigoriglobus tundricola]|nr:hypothetical protein [Frigoriglobus tundricola]